MINLKIQKVCIPYLQFKMEGLHLLNDMLKEKDYMCKRPEGCSLLCSTALKTLEVHRRVGGSVIKIPLSVSAWDQLNEFLQTY